MTSAKLDLSGLSRRELQLLAKEFQLCRGNAKSDVIAQHLDEFIAANANGEKLVLAALGDTTSAGKPSPVKVPSAKPSVAKPSPAKASPAKASPAKASPAKVSAKKPSPTSARATPPVVSPKHNVDDRSESSGDDETGFHPARPAPRRNAQPIAPRANKVSPSKATAVKASLTASGGTPSSERKREEPKTASAASPTTKRKRSELAAAKTAGESSVKKTGASSSKTAETTPERNTANVSTTKSSPTVIETTKSAPASAVVENSAKPVSTPAEVTAFVSTVDDLEFTKDGRVRCSTTSHEMKADLAVIKEHLNGKRYARARKEKKLSLATYAPMFSEHPDEKLASHMVWCNVTESAISRTRQQIEAHITGPRYQKELPRWKEEQAAKAKAEAEEAERLLARKRAIQKRKLDLGNDERKKGDAKRKKVNGERKKGKSAAASSTAA